jgi:anthranilate/para-aminobenzoate synthase component I
VSQIHGKLALEQTGADLIRAVFPGGSITGAPKRRAMQIISQLEGEGRGFYTGSLALLTPQDTISMSILIRTLVKDDEGWSLSVGGGIVAKSVASREIEETWEKVAIFKEVLSQALDGA